MDHFECMCVCMYECIYVCKYICICVYINFICHQKQEFSLWVVFLFLPNLRRVIISFFTRLLFVYLQQYRLPLKLFQSWSNKLIEFSNRKFCFVLFLFSFIIWYCEVALHELLDKCMENWAYVAMWLFRRSEFDGRSTLVGQRPMKLLSSVYPSVNLSVTKFSQDWIISFFLYCTWW